MTFRFIALLIPLLALVGCDKKDAASAEKAANKNAGEVTLYSSIDEPYLRPLIKQFQEKTGIRVTLVTDAEASKTAGLAQKIEAEKDHPNADVYWGNEPFHTINLVGADLLLAHEAKHAANIAADWKQPNHLYTAIGLRARMIVLSTRPENAAIVAGIKNLADLANPALKGRIGMANPAFGTTSGQLASLYMLMGADKTETKYVAYLNSLRSNGIKLLGGNSAVVEQVAAGNLVAGLTDNDDVNNAIGEGAKVRGVLPDQDDGGNGTLLIPSTIALVKGAPHAENGKKLIDFLTDPAIEKQLIDAKFFAASVRANESVRGMKVDYLASAKVMRRAVELALSTLQDRLMQNPSTAAAEHVCPPAEPMTVTEGWEPGMATYTAEQSGGVVRIHAKGENPSPGYETKLGMQLIKIYPPQFSLYRKPPEGMAAQVMTPFDVCVSFTAKEPIATLVIKDKDGDHRVDVKQTP